MRIKKQAYTCQKPVWIEATVCLYLLYICHLVIHRELQIVVYMKKNRCSRKRGEGPVHKYLWSYQSNPVNFFYFLWHWFSCKWRKSNNQKKTSLIFINLTYWRVKHAIIILEIIRCIKRIKKNRFYNNIFFYESLFINYDSKWEEFITDATLTSQSKTFGIYKIFLNDVTKIPVTRLISSPLRS